MLTKDAVASIVRPAVLGRGRMLAKRPGYIWQRSCHYDASHTSIGGRVESSSGYRASYMVRASFDEEADQLVSYGCNCPASYRYAGPCKHVVALTLDFIANPESYDGFDAMQHVQTSSALAQLLNRLAGPATPRRSSASTEGAGTVHLVPQIYLGAYDQILSLKIRGTNGTYVVKDIGDLVDWIENHAYHEYGKKLAFTHEEGAFAPEDRPLLRLLQDCVYNRRSFVRGHYGYSYGYGSGSSAMRDLRLSTPELDRLLLIMEGRHLKVLGTSFTSSKGGRRDEQNYLVKKGDPQFSVSIERVQDDSYRLAYDGDEIFGLLSTGRHLFALTNDQILRCSKEVQDAEDFLETVLGAYGTDLVMTAEDTRRFAASVLPRIEAAFDVDVPPEVDAMRPEPLRACFYLDRNGRSVTCDAVANYGERRFDLCGRGGERLGKGEKVSQEPLVRDYDAEHEARQVVQRYFKPVRGSHLLATKTDADSVARAIFEGVPELARVGEVLATDAFQRLMRTKQPRVDVGVSVRSGLIDLSISSEDLPPRELAAVLESYRLRKRYHRLRDGTFLSLEDADLDDAARVVDELGVSSRELAREHLQIPSYKAFLLDALVPDEDKDASFERYVEEFRTTDPASFAIPESLAGRLRAYQEEGYRWLCALAYMGFGGILADEMGLGKSVQLIAFLLAHRGEGPTLIVCPASLVYNWLAEFEKFAPTMDVVAAAGTVEERCHLREEAHEVYVSSYDLVRRDVEDWAGMSLWCVTLDEAQYIKNQQTLSAQAVKTLDAQVRFALTGTPIENRLSEMWSIFDFLMPGLLGSYERFRERYEEAVVAGDEEATKRLRAAVEPFILRRLKRDVLADLPEKLERVVSCRMTREQRRLYVAREQALRTSIAASSESDFATGKLQVLAELTRLRQLCCDPRLVYEDYHGESAKLETIVQLVALAVDGGEKVLVFSQFTSFLALVAKRLEDDGLRFYEITGATPKRRRVELVDAFNADDVPVFLVSLKAGGTGLNLVGASVVIHADPWWNAAAQNQATDRAHRIGQTRDVSVHKVICANTIEERIVALQAAKVDLAEAVVGDGGDAVLSLASLRREDLLELLGE